MGQVWAGFTSEGVIPKIGEGETINIEQLGKAVESHSGVFLCTQIHESSTKEAPFGHQFDPPSQVPETPIESLASFYGSFGNLTLYFDPVTEEAAIYLVSPDEGEFLDTGFRGSKNDFPGWLRSFMTLSAS